MKTEKKFMNIKYFISSIFFVTILFFLSNCISAGEYLIHPGENILSVPVENLDYSVGAITIKVTINNEADWLGITPKEHIFSDIQPNEERAFDFILTANCNLTGLEKISGEVSFLYESLTSPEEQSRTEYGTGVIGPVREVTHTFIIDKTVGFVANRKESGTVTVINLDPCGNAGDSLAQLSVGNNPYGVAVSMDGRQIYVTNSGEGSLSIIDLNFDPDDPNPTFENAVETKIPLGFTPNLIAITPDNSRAYIADKFSGSIKVINLIWWTYFDGGTSKTGKVYAPYEFIREIKIFGSSGIGDYSIEAMAIDPTGRRLWVVVRQGMNLESKGGYIAVVDIEQIVMRSPNERTFHEIIDTIDLQRLGLGPLDEPSGIAFTPDGDLAYITGEGTTELIHVIQNWRDATGGIVVVDPKAVYDPYYINQGGQKIIDYIHPQVYGSKHELIFLRAPRVDYTPFMGLGGGIAAGFIFGMQEAHNTLASMFDQTIYKYPVDTDGAESIAISPDGTRAYITFLNTNNFGIIDLTPSKDASGFNWSNPPSDNDIYAASEAILIDPNPMSAFNPAAFRFPNEIAFSRDGHYIMISNMSYTQDLVEIVDDTDMDKILANVSKEDLKEKPINEFPTGDVSIYGDLIRYVGTPSGIDDPEGIAMIPGYDNDGDMKAGGSSNLVEAKNRFNSLLNISGNLSKNTLISSNDSNLLSPVIPNPFDLSQSKGRPYGDILNNYEAQNVVDTTPGQLINGVLLPTEGLGYRHDFGKDPYNTDNVGILTLINLLEDIGREWFLRHPKGPRIIYLDLSRPGGGQFFDLNEQNPLQLHAAHQNGLDVSIRYMRKDKSENPFDFVESNVTGRERDNSKENIVDYDPNYSTELINMFLNDERAATVAVDPRVIERAEWAGLEIITSDKLIIRGSIDDPNSRRDYDDHFGIRVNYRNLPPIANAGNDKVVNVGETFILDGLSSYDPDGDEITYKWSQKEGPSAGLTDKKAKEKAPSLVCPNIQNSSGEHEYLVFGLFVFDGEFDSQEDTVKITINRKPIANAGVDQTVEAGQEITLNGSQSYDPDGDELTFAWTQIEGATVGNFEEEMPTFIAPEENTTLVYELVLYDGYVKSEPDTVVISVILPETPLPPPPTAGNLVINEIVIDPKTDWSSMGYEMPWLFDPNNQSIDLNDQWIEIYNISLMPIDLTGCSLMMIDSSPATHFLGNNSGVEVYSEGSSLNNLLPDGFLVIGNPDGLIDVNCYIKLMDSQQNIIDCVEIGDDYQSDGVGDGAPESGKNGTSYSFSDEAIARIPNGVDTNNDINDFEKTFPTPGDFNY